MAAADLPVGELAIDRELAMPGPGGELALRLFDPRPARDSGPVVVFYHGGGFCVGSIGSHAGLSAEIARGLDLPVVSVEYRLAPEHQWPAAPDDAEAAARWIADNARAFEQEFNGLILCGDSAGGNLALVTAIALRNDPASLSVVQQLAFYPGTDTLGDYPSRTAFGGVRPRCRRHGSVRGALPGRPRQLAPHAVAGRTGGARAERASHRRARSAAR